MPDVGISFDGRYPLPAARELARAAEAAGAGSFWVSSHLFFRDPFATAAVLLGATASARVTLMAVSPFVMHPVHIAMAGATLDELAPGRVAVCLGSGAPVDLAGAGVEPRRRVRTLAEAIDVVRALLDGERVTYAGQVFRVGGRRLDGGTRKVPVLLAAAGPQTLELAGRLADGVVISTSTSVEFVRWALGQVERAAKGRSLRRVGQVYVAVAERERDAFDRFRRTLAMTLQGAHHARNVAASGAALDQAELRRAVSAEDWAVAEQMITDDIVRKHTATGTLAGVRERLAEYRAAGLDEIVLASMRDPDEVSRTLAAVRG